MALEVAGDDPLEIKHAMLGLLAKVQEKHGPDELPLLTQWFSRELEPLVELINSQTVREDLRRKIQKLAGSGDLSALASCLDNDTVRKADSDGRDRAAREFSGASKEIAQLESEEFKDSAQRLGWKIAVGISNSVLGLTVVTLLMASYRGDWGYG